MRLFSFGVEKGGRAHGKKGRRERAHKKEGNEGGGSSTRRSLSASELFLYTFSIVRFYRLPD